MLLRVTTLILAIAAFGSADTLTLRSGRVVRGQYVGGDARHVKMEVGDRVDTYSVDDIESLQFSLGQKLNSETENAPPTSFARQPEPPPPAPAPRSYDQASRDQSSRFEIPIGTSITVRMIDGVNSEQTRLGQTFQASVDEPVVVDGQTVIPRGADAVTKLVEDKQSGKFEGRTVLTLVLQQVMINGRMLDISTGDVSQESNSRGSRTAKVVGGTTAVGAIIGAIAGGGKGAAIGAASGAAVGGTAQAVTKGQVVKIPPETRLTFSLQQPVQL
ncbi:MAG: hypothetical protein LAP38_19385 [Acidobacteriia bacterium]|nr:hypothetical protein [Terriglobia bacterium]